MMIEELNHIEQHKCPIYTSLYWGQTGGFWVNGRGGWNMVSKRGLG